MLLMCSAEQKRFCANGRSMLTVYGATLSFSPATASSNFLVCMLHTGVSSDGTTLNRRALVGVFARVTTSKGPVTQAKLGAASPVFSCGPTSDSDLSLNFTVR